MFKRWRRLAAAAGAICFPFALARAAAPLDDVPQCTRHNYPEYRDRAQFDWHNYDQDSWYKGYFGNFSSNWNERAAAGDLPGADDVNAGFTPDPARGGDDDFSVELGFQEFDDSTTDAIADEAPAATTGATTPPCDDPDRPSNQPDLNQGDDSSSAKLGTALETEPATSEFDETIDDVAVPCLDAVTLGLPEALPDTAANLGAPTFCPTPLDFGGHSLNIYEPYFFNDSEDDEFTDSQPSAPPNAASLTPGLIEFDELARGQFELGAINELNDGIDDERPTLRGAELTGTIEYFEDDSDSDVCGDDFTIPAAAPPDDSAAELEFETDPGIGLQFHMFYPGFDWSE